MVHGKKKIVSIENNPLHCENLIELLKIEFWYNGWYGEGVYKTFVFILLFIIKKGINKILDWYWLDITLERWRYQQVR